MYKRYAHTVEPLTNLPPSKLILKLNEVEQKSFKKIKWIVARSNYPYFNKWFEIHTTARDLHLGVVIRKELKSIYIYIRKLTYP